MGADPQPDFGGYATKAGLRCSDGRVIQPKAFQHMDGVTVPLVWQHGHNKADNVLGHAVLESRPDGVYAYGFFNGTPNGVHAKGMVVHKDIQSLSIYANQLKETNNIVSHGSIKEVSLVLSGANPGAKIDYVRIQHSDDPDDVTELPDEAIIKHMTDHLDLPEELEKVQYADDESEGDGETLRDVYDSMNVKQKNVLHYFVGEALENTPDNNTAEHSEVETDESTDENTDKGDIAHQEGTTDMTRNVFDQSGVSGDSGPHISHSDVKAIFEHGKKLGSFKEAIAHFLDTNETVLQHGITNVETLFPDFKATSDRPEFNKRRTEWVSGVLSGVSRTPFTKIKQITADLTQDDARAKGYITGTYKKEEWFGVSARTTDATTVYKKQKLDRDVILDITDFDIVAWLWGEIRLMLEEELARAILIGDGRDVSNEDKIKDPAGAAEGSGIRSIVNEHELYATTMFVNVLDSNSSYEEVVDAVMNGFEFYKGSGTPTFYTTVKQLNKFKQAKDLNGQRYYKNNAEVAEALGVDRIVTVEPMNEVSDLIGIIVNLVDYNVGTNKGGEITSFDDFDIDYNQYKYLMETRVSGALTKIKSALIIKGTASASVLVTPTKPGFVASTGVITIPNDANVVYKDGSTTLTAGAQTALAAGASKTITAVPAANKHFASNAEQSWTFKRNAA